MAYYYIIFLSEVLFKFLSVLLPILISVAFLTLAERKILAAMQKRKGPNVVGFGGLLQPFADGVKLLVKEAVLPVLVDLNVFTLAPIISLMLSLSFWALYPFTIISAFANINLGFLYILAVSSLGVYSILLAGWSTNSIYAFLGALRSAAQMISYEVSIGIILLNVFTIVGSLSLIDVVKAQQEIWFIVPCFVPFLLFLISIVAETNRAPFDLPEAEGELVAGYNVEYSGVGFVLFFLAEYNSMIFMSAFTVLLFFGGWLPIFSFLKLSPIFWFAIKTLFVLFFFVWIRAAFPRYRYDQLMRLGWKVFLPISLAWLLCVFCVIYLIDIL